MTSPLPDPSSGFGARVARRLREERLAWLTVVDRAGTPQPAPVWFLWDDASASALVDSRGDAKRLGHMRANPRVALHLDGNGTGGDIVVLTGAAVEAPDEPPASANPD
ncbi:MAG TPA: pyridoxamine 5'-phosphate oxidase family protein [Actinomycetota bacterium]|nr:pyridoxamine 5'-phosphate oxidase family protein [Actinomycetota bacterium]